MYKFNFNLPLEGNSPHLQITPVERGGGQQDNYPALDLQPRIFLQWVHFISASPDRMSLGKGFSASSPEFLGSLTHMNLLSNSENQELFVISRVFDLILRVQEFKTIEEKSKSKHELSSQDSVLISGGSSKDLYRRFQGNFSVGMTKTME